MKQGINKVTILGHVGESPKIRETKDNVMVASLSMATNDFYRDKEGREVKSTEWHKVVAWDKKAGIIKDYVKKGDLLLIEGRLKTSSYEDKDGVKKYSTDITCENLYMLSSKTE